MLNSEAFGLDVDDLTRSIELSAIILDRDLRVRFMTASAARLLQVEDVIVGSKLDEVPGLMDQARLIDDARGVLAGGEAVERLVLCASGECAMRRSQPYLARRTSAEGVVITLTKRGSRSAQDGFAGPDRGSFGGRWDEETERVVGKLTARQREIMTLVLAGHPSKKIAAELGISSRTVENHRASIMHRTGCRSLPELTRFALGATPGGFWS